LSKIRNIFSKEAKLNHFAKKKLDILKTFDKYSMPINKNITKGIKVSSILNLDKIKIISSGDGKAKKMDHLEAYTILGSIMFFKNMYNNVCWENECADAACGDWFPFFSVGCKSIYPVDAITVPFIVTYNNEEEKFNVSEFYYKKLKKAYESIFEGEHLTYFTNNEIVYPDRFLEYLPKFNLKKLDKPGDDKDRIRDCILTFFYDRVPTTKLNLYGGVHTDSDSNNIITFTDKQNMFITGYSSVTYTMNYPYSYIGNYNYTTEWNNHDHTYTKFFVNYPGDGVADGTWDGSHIQHHMTTGKGTHLTGIYGVLANRVLPADTICSFFDSIPLETEWTPVVTNEDTPIPVYIITEEDYSYERVWVGGDCNNTSYTSNTKTYKLYLGEYLIDESKSEYEKYGNYKFLFGYLYTSAMFETSLLKDVYFWIDVDEKPQPCDHDIYCEVKENPSYPRNCATICVNGHKYGFVEYYKGYHTNSVYIDYPDSSCDVLGHCYYTGIQCGENATAVRIIEDSLHYKCFLFFSPDIIIPTVSIYHPFEDEEGGWSMIDESWAYDLTGHLLGELYEAMIIVYQYEQRPDNPTVCNVYISLHKDETTTDLFCIPCRQLLTFPTILKGKIYEIVDENEKESIGTSYEAPLFGYPFTFVKVGGDISVMNNTAISDNVIKYRIKFSEFNLRYVSAPRVVEINDSFNVSNKGMEFTIKLRDTALGVSVFIGKQTEYEYDEFGNLVEVTDSNIRYFHFGDFFPKYKKEDEDEREDSVTIFIPEFKTLDFGGPECSNTIYGTRTVFAGEMRNSLGLHKDISKEIVLTHIERKDDD